MSDKHIHSKHCGCDHSNPNADSQSLYSLIDKNKIVCLNESVSNSGRKVFKPASEKLTDASFVESEDDHELLFTIPFSDNVKITGIIISSTDPKKHPKTVCLFKDRSSINFDNVHNPDQILELSVDCDGEVIYDLKPTKFSSLSHLSIYVSQNYGDDITQIDYIELRGKFMSSLRKKVVVDAVYELRPNASKTKTEDLSAIRFIQ